MLTCRSKAAICRQPTACWQCQHGPPHTAVVGQLFPKKCWRLKPHVLQDEALQFSFVLPSHLQDLCLVRKKTNGKQAVLSSRASQVQVLHPQKVPHECLRNRVGQAQLANRTTHTVHTAVARAALCWVTSARPSGFTANSVFTRVVGLFLFSFLLYLCESYGSFVPLFIWNLEKMLREHWDCSLCCYFWGCFHPLAWSAFHCCKSQKCEGRCLDTLPLKNDRMLLFLLFTLRLNLTGLTRSAMEDTSASIMRKRKQDRWVSCLLELPAPLSLVEACRAPLKNDNFFKLLLLAENKHPRILSREYDDEDPIIRARFVLGYFTNAHKFFCF